MWQMGGLGRRMPITAITCLVGALALAGIFPLSGFWSKDEILAAAWSSHLPGHHLFLLLALGTVSLTAFYMFRLWFLTFSGSARSEQAASARESPLVMTLPLLILAALAAVGGGLRARVPWTDAGFAEVVRFGAQHEAAAPPLLLAVSIAAAVFGIVLAWAAYRANLISPAAFNARLPAVYRLLKRAWYINDGWEFFATRVVLAGSALAAWFDRRVVNGMVDGVAWLSGWSSQRLRLTQTGQVQLYCFVVLAGIIAGLVVILGAESEFFSILGGGP